MDLQLVITKDWETPPDQLKHHVNHFDTLGRRLLNLTRQGCFIQSNNYEVNLP